VSTGQSRLPCGVRPESQKPAAINEQIPLLTAFADIKGNLKIILLTFPDPFLEMILKYEEWSQRKRSQFSGGERKNVTAQHSRFNKSFSM